MEGMKDSGGVIEVFEVSFVLSLGGFWGSSVVRSVLGQDNKLGFQLKCP